MKTTNWTIVNDETAKQAALKLARGDYQANLISGRENLSGSTLRGKARRYAGRYAASRRNLLDRLRAAGIAVAEQRGPRGARLLALG
jgi:hypothetical protein